MLATARTTAKATLFYVAYLPIPAECLQLQGQKGYDEDPYIKAFYVSKFFYRASQMT